MSKQARTLISNLRIFEMSSFKKDQGNFYSWPKYSGLSLNLGSIFGLIWGKHSHLWFVFTQREFSEQQIDPTYIRHFCRQNSAWSFYRSQCFLYACRITISFSWRWQLGIPDLRPEKSREKTSSYITIINLGSSSQLWVFSLFME